MIREAVAQAETRRGSPPPVCLLSGWDYQALRHDEGAEIEGLEVIPVYNLLPGCCVVGWEEEAPAPKAVAGSVKAVPESEQVLLVFQGLLLRHKGRGLDLKRGSAPWKREMGVAKSLIRQCGGLDAALRVVALYFQDRATSWQNPVSLTYVQKAAPAMLAAIHKEEERQAEMEEQAGASRRKLAEARLGLELMRDREDGKPA